MLLLVGHHHQLCTLVATISIIMISSSTTMIMLMLRLTHFCNRKYGTDASGSPTAIRLDLTWDFQQAISELLCCLPIS